MQNHLACQKSRFRGLNPPMGHVWHPCSRESCSSHLMHTGKTFGCSKFGMLLPNHIWVWMLVWCCLFWMDTQIPAYLCCMCICVSVYVFLHVSIMTVVLQCNRGLCFSCQFSSNHILTEMECKHFVLRLFSRRFFICKLKKKCKVVMKTLKLPDRQRSSFGVWAFWTRCFPQAKWQPKQLRVELQTFNWCPGEIRWDTWQ